MKSSIDGYRYLYARKLQKALKSGEFRILSSEPYVNELGVKGMEYTCAYRNRRFYLSESPTQEPSDITYFLKVLSNQNDISTSKPLIWPNRWKQECLYLEVWSFGKWHKFHAPLAGSNVEDEFFTLIAEVLEARN
jgi:hypothetical protein